MSLVTREQKGSKLSSVEMDDNLLWLSQTLSGSDGTGVIQVTGSSLDASNTPITSSFFTGDGSALTNVTASYLPGIDGSQLTNVTASYISPSIIIPVNGTNTQIQFNSGSVLSGSDHLVYNYISQSLEHGSTNHTTIGLYSHAEGNATTTMGNYSHTEGFSTRTGVYGYTIDSVTFDGTDTIILLDSSYGDVSGGNFNVAYLLIKTFTITTSQHDNFLVDFTGTNTRIKIFDVDLTSINASIVILSDLNGNQLKPNPTNADVNVGSDYAHAEGNLTNAVNTYAHAEGYRNIAAGFASHAEGDTTLTLGKYSHTEGFRTIASGDYQLVVGQYNVASTSQSAFIIGDGTNIGRHNILFVSQSHFEVSASNMYLQGLANSSQTYVVAIDTATGQLSYTLASGVGSLTPPGGNDKAIQFNSGSGFSGSNKFTYDYDNDIVILTGSILVTNGFTGSLFGTASYITGSVFTNDNPALSASYALTASFSMTASYITGSIFTSTNPALSASYALSSSRAATASFALTASYVTGSIFTNANPALSASYALSSSQTNTASYALYALNGGTSGNPGGSPGEIQYNSGGTAFDGVPTLTFDGSTLTATGSFTGSLTGSLFGTSSWAQSASQALTASFITTAQTASYVLQAVSASFSTTASFVITAQTASYVLQAVSASFATTASYISGSIFTSTNRALSASNALTSSYNSNMRASSASVSDFVSAGGGDYISNQIFFSPPFPNKNYAITVTGEDARSWTIQSKESASFVINTNSNTILSGPVYWIAMQFNN